MLAAVGLACVGCHAGTSYVYVDTLSAVDSIRSPVPPMPRGDAKLLPPTSTAFRIAGSPAATESRSAAEGATKVKASIAANREKTYRTIVRRLHDAYLREADN